jgi:hypothetical protein
LTPAFSAVHGLGAGCKSRFACALDMRDDGRRLG